MYGQFYLFVFSLYYQFYPIPIAFSPAMHAQQTLNLKAQAGVNYIRITNSSHQL